MRVSGFTFIRHGVRLGYPFEASIRSILPIVDEFIVCVGAGGDDTRDRVLAIGDSRIRVVDSVWNEGMRDRGFVYAQQKMIAHFQCTGDWAFYLEADEVVHEEDLPAVVKGMERYLDRPDVEALAFDYLHFYGTPGQVADSPAWYRRAVRIVRNSVRMYSPDGLFFAVLESNRRGRYPRAASIGVPMYHYGHVRSTTSMAEKISGVGPFFGAANIAFEGYGRIDPRVLRPFSGTHPAVVREWLATEAEQEWRPDPGYRISRREGKHRLMMWMERTFGLELSKKHFRLVDEDGTRWT
jgi:hypothetical protein